MKKINRDFYLAFLRENGKQNKHLELINSIFSLKVNEGVIVSKEEWSPVGLPSTLLGYHVKKRGLKIKFSTKKGREGYAIFRVK